MKNGATFFSFITMALIFSAILFLWQPFERTVPSDDLPPINLPPINLPPVTGDLSRPIDRILVEKAARRLTLFRQGERVKIYKIALGFTPTGTKLREGDGKTPEGMFKIDRRNDKSAFHLSLGIDYPQAADLARAKAGGYSAGGDIFFHGQPNAWQGPAIPDDWTAGCIALSNAEIQELWRITPVGTMVEIRP